MTSEIANYDFRGNNVRILTDQDNAPWFIAKDICDVLGTETRDISKILDDDEFSNVDSIHIAQNGGRAPLIVSESGFYKLVMRSRKPVAKEFQRWVTRDVLPSIRKHGAYMTPDTIREALADPDTLIMLATRLKEETEERVVAQERVRMLEPKARAYEDFCEAPDLLTVRDAAAQLTTAGLPIRECELRAWMLDHQWIYRHGGAYRPYAAHSTAGHLRLVPPKRSGRHRDGTPFPFDPTCKITRRGLCLLYQRIGAERVRDQLQYTDTQYPFDEEV
ncbi:phage antirepressor protein [Bifidobacterium pseudolongum subsp. globosum]|uniref:phage antirepressor n=1 Tax=Bifidobacterium pseudolongum TaxID=1694 RepID=UPI000C700D2E|nr:phage antirepressor [Bifidobacterium pseudolongum]PKV05730.1 phage antirepressor protein [Bifidobacterium pseudolongum subsp. globosum]RYQ56581.1 phage antirepressor protein [Bifidobacterium pseudolongum subsp. globosum]RYQ60502.1 phage antirepressor protein [Bifidobacterium pseudolongum subsp. globosum]